MELSFFHSYVNLLIWGCGAFLSFFIRGNALLAFPIIVLPILIGLAILVGFYQLLDNTCYSCCYPITERSVMGNQEESQQDDETIEMNQLA